MPSRSSPPFDLEGLDHILLLVGGMSKSVTFYREVLGCKVEDRLPEYGMVQLRVGNALIDLVDIESKAGAWARGEVAGGRNLDHVCIAISRHDEKKLRAHFAAHEVEIVEEGVHGGARGESLSLYIKDPSGNTLELKGPP